MGDSAVLQEIRLRAPKVTGVEASHKETEKTYKNYLTPLGIEPTNHQLPSCNFDHYAIYYWLNTVLL